MPAFLRGTPGRRFSALHRARRRRRGVVKALSIAAGVLLMILGVLLLPTPGPGLLCAALGAALIAGESRAFARALDRLELRLREAIGRASEPASPAPGNSARPARRRCP